MFILTAIGTDSLNEDRWADFFERLAIPRRMAPLFRNVIENLYDNYVVDNDEFDINDEIKNIGFTDTGRDLFEQGRIKQEPKIFREPVFYAPYVKQSDPTYFFSIKTTNQEDFKAEAFDSVTYDFDKLRQFIIDNKSHVGAGSEDEILSVNVDGIPDMLCTTKKINLLFNELTGDFSFETGMDTNFVKGYFSASDILSENTELFAISNDLALDKVRIIPSEWESYKYQLPSAFSFKGKLSVYNPSECFSEKAFALDNLDFTFVDIIDSFDGRGYISTKKNVQIMGLNGSKDFVLLASRPLSSGEIKKILGDICNAQDLSDPETFVEFLPVTDIADDENFQFNIVKRHLESSKDIVGSVKKLKKVNIFKQTLTLGSIVEDVLCNRENNVDNIIDILQNCEIKCGCEEICSKFVTNDGDTDLKLADRLFSVCLNKGVVTASLGIRGIMAKNILSGKTGDYKSKELSTMNNTAKAFVNLKKYFGINTVNDYDLSKYDESQNNDVLKTYSIATKGIEDIGPIMAGSEENSELEEYMNLIQNLIEVYCKDAPLESLSGFLFGAGIRRKIDILLKTKVKSTELKGMIDEAHDMGLIDKGEQTMLHMIRDYGNKCVHTSDFSPIDSTKKQEWVKAVNNLEKKLGIKGGRK